MRPLEVVVPKTVSLQLCKKHLTDINHLSSAMTVQMCQLLGYWVLWQ